jgi:hypothetical protein
MPTSEGALANLGEFLAPGPEGGRVERQWVGSRAIDAQAVERKMARLAHRARSSG